MNVYASDLEIVVKLCAELEQASKNDSTWDLSVVVRNPDGYHIGVIKVNGDFDFLEVDFANYGNDVA